LLIGIVWKMPTYRYKVRQEIKGRIIGVRQVQDRGRIQIPKDIRRKLDLKDGDKVYWVYSPDGRFYIVKAMEIE